MDLSFLFEGAGTEVLVQKLLCVLIRLFRIATNGGTYIGAGSVFATRLVTSKKDATSPRLEHVERLMTEPAFSPSSFTAVCRAAAWVTLRSG
jgi:hypothetical protein